MSSIIISAKRGLTASVALLGVAVFAAPGAQAGAGASAGVRFPASVAVGQTGLHASIAISNANTPPHGSAANTVQSIELVAACKQLGAAGCAATGIDPGVFAVSATGSGRALTSCAGKIFDAAPSASTPGKVTFTPRGAAVTLPGAGATCAIDFTVDVLTLPVDHDPSRPGRQTAQVASNAQTCFPPGCAPAPLSAAAFATSSTSVLQISAVEDAAEADDHFGATVARGNFNGDPWEDLAISVPDEDIDGVVDAGAVNVIYGSAAGLDPSSPPDQIWHQNSTDVEDVAETGDRFGTRLAVGRFDDDAIDDLAIATPFEDVGTVVDAGAVNVIHGSAGGLSASGGPEGTPDQLWSQDSAGIEDSAEAGDLFGWDLAAADFNGDGYADLASSVYVESVGSVAQAGAVHVIHGSGDGLSATATPDQLWSQDSPGVEDVAEPGDRFGVRLAVGRLNGDAYADLVVSAPYEDTGTRAVVDAGAVHVIHGSSAGLSATFVPDQLWTQGSAGVDDVAEANDQFGLRVEVGGFNGDGYDDLAVGVPYEDVGTIVDAGAVNVINGTGSGLTALFGDDQLWTQNSAAIEDASEAGDLFGWHLAAGHFDADGYGDLAISAYAEDVGAIEDAGAVHTIHGSSGGLNATLVPDALWTQDSSGVEDEAEAGDLFGRGLVAGRFNGDGYDDLAIGVLYEDVGTFADAGAVNVIYGAAGGLNAVRVPDQLWHQDS